MLYKVMIDYKPFTFADGSTAISFAEIAKEHGDENPTVTIDIVEEEDE